MWLALAVLGCNGDKTETTDTDPGTPHTGRTGSGIEEVTDLFEQDLVDDVDILWVVDADWDEGMDGIDAGLDLIEETLLLNDVDWRMGVLDSTDQNQQFGLIGTKWQAYPTPNGAFVLGFPGPESKVYEGVYTAFELRKDNEANEEFLRSSAELYVLVVTDRNDDSRTGDLDTKDWKDWFSVLEPSNARRLGVVTVSSKVPYWEERAVDASVRTSATNLPKVLDEMILEAIRLETSFTLSQVPSVVPPTIEVIYKDHPTVYNLDQDYTYDAATNTITFKRVRPPDTSIVRVKYPVGGIPTPTETGATE